MNLIRAYLKAKDRGVSADEFMRHVGVDGRLMESLDGSNSSLREELTSGERAIVEAAAVRAREARQSRVQESKEDWLRRHTTPAPSACFVGHRALQEATDSGKLTAFRQRHVKERERPVPAPPATGRRLAALQEDLRVANSASFPTGNRETFRRRHTLYR